MSDVIILDHLKEPTEERFKKFIIGECRRMDRLDVYKWVADDELKIKQLQQENKQLKEKVGELTQSLNEQMKLTNEENLDCSKYAIENQQLKEVIEEVREYANEKIKFNDDQIKEYKTCITTNINGKFPKEVKENMEHSMTISMCINYKLKNIVQILDKVKESDK